MNKTTHWTKNSFASSCTPLHLQKIILRLKAVSLRLIVDFANSTQKHDTLFQCLINQHQKDINSWVDWLVIRLLESLCPISSYLTRKWWRYRIIWSYFHFQSSMHCYSNLFNTTTTTLSSCSIKETSFIFYLNITIASW